ncbi:HD domain-containing protein, putative [Entamoeba dispar SAW760]|uniref:Guanosine-3',5'-bis(diphosphate) 3'-pyrophosphohydrolase MESH1 n=1 Tax=Entamoeba dispar (strain ATCC PRA-260 / SAW760) TaxID=370354 RepID=B0EA61_ENTDS|nr:HD domain-containing protein, putative [Entamoeba dispar SAW760]EDR28585.1 HD domain-containing protein, putative [Entamoeba dispar SAW760]|eukprot:EDR28585.1 HD domain-containing protein, putative [Entamoeba dispar SAW760]
MNLDFDFFLSVLEFATHKHRFQLRKDGASYIEHPIKVCKILKDAGINDIEILSGALLHDTVEDTNTTFEELEEHFGKQITQYVREVTDDKKLDKVTRKKLQIEHSGTISYGGKMIKYADKIQNMGSIISTVPCPFKPYEVAQGYMVWGKKVSEAFRGINSILDKQFDEILKGNITDDNGKIYPALPEGNLDEFLLHYYDLIHDQK